MQSSVVRLELSPEAAQLALGIVEGFHSQTAQRLTGVVPVHTKRVLEEQLENSAEAVRAFTVAVENPVEVEIPDPPGFSA